MKEVSNEKEIIIILIKAKIFKKRTKMHYKEIFEIKHLKCLSEEEAIFMTFYNSLWMEWGMWRLMLLLI